jgi:hypothetical protein
MEGEGEGYWLGGQWKVKEKVLCLVANGRRRRRFFSTSSHFPPKQLYLDLHFFPFDIKVLLYHSSRPLFTHSLPFPWPINYNRVFLMSQVPHTFIIDSIWLKISSIFLEIMASHMATSYGPQVAQMNEELTSESSLDLMLMQHPHDENPAP